MAVRMVCNLMGRIPRIPLGTGLTSAILVLSSLSGQDRTAEMQNLAGQNTRVLAEAQGSRQHTVKLTWKPSVPASKLPRDAIKGYNIYRSRKSHDRNAKLLNSSPVPDTSYVDSNVEHGKVYYYVVRGVNARGTLSGPSIEIRVEIPR